MRIITLMLFVVAVTAQADEAACLAEIIYSEARGESAVGKMAVAEASINRAIRTGRDLCSIRGVTRRRVPTDYRPDYRAIARLVMATERTIVGVADSWDTGMNLGHRIGRHRFYRMIGQLR